MGRWLTPVRLYIIGAAISISIAIAANLFAAGALTTIGATFAILAPLATLLVVDRLTTLRDTYDLREEILDSIRDAGRSSGQVISLGSDDAWVRYIERNATGAKAILNTRLSGFAGLFDAYHNRIDNAILRAISSGTDYTLICATERLHTLENLIQGLPDRSSRQGKKAGQVRAYSLDTAGKPLIQMKIFDYDGGYSEAMVGFIATSAHDVAQPIFLVRNLGLVEYMRHLFYSYCVDPGAEEKLIY